MPKAHRLDTRAQRDYTILKTYEAGIVLIGNEVKSLRAGQRRWSTRSSRSTAAS